MGGQVVKTKWWGNVQRTEGQSASEHSVVIQPTSLDVLSDQVARAMNHVVHCQTELARAQYHLEQTQQAWINRMLDVAQQNGIKDFKFKPLPKTDADD